jgi:GTPase SAR1 family protein
MYDVMNPKSYETAKDWVETAKSATKDNIAILLVSNKNDISEDKHKVKNSDAEKFAATE